MPPLSWGWPRDGLDLLLRATLDQDQHRAQLAFNQWLHSHSIDKSGGRDHRLLALLAERFADQLAHRPEGPRLAGLRRQRWTRTQLTLGLAKPALERMLEAGLSPLALGETAALCSSPSGSSHQPQRLDILLPDASLDPGLTILGEAGWQPWSGESMLCLRQRANALRTMQLVHGQFGAMAVHRWVLADPSTIRALQDDLNRTRVTGSLHGIPVALPSTTERLAMALGRHPLDQPPHGLLEAAMLLDRDDLDWNLLMDILQQSASAVVAQIHLSYLHRRLHRPLPGPPLARLRAMDASPWQRLLDGLDTRPVVHPWSATAVTAKLSKRPRLSTANSAYSQPRACFGWVMPRAGLAEVVRNQVQRQWLIALPGKEDQQARFQLELRVPVLCFAQQLVFELQTERRHLIALKVWSLWPGTRVVRVRFRGRLSLPAGDRHLWIAARPARQLRANATEASRQRLGASGFQVIKLELSHADALI